MKARIRATLVTLPLPLRDWRVVDECVRHGIEIFLIRKLCRPLGAGRGIPAWCDTTFRSYCDREGTSASTAITAASAALIWSAHPNWTANQVTRSLIDTASRTWAKDNPSKYAGYGAIRPRKVLENSDYNAGPANADPLSKENGGKPATEGSASPSASASAPSQAPNTTSGGQTSAAGSNAESSSDSNSLWIALGAAAAVIVVGGVGVAVLRARRAR